MKVVIVGAGEVGYHVVGALYREGVEIVAIDQSQSVLDQLKSEFNIATLQGNASDSSLLEQANVGQADLFLAITNTDETNIISCLFAGSAGARHKIARVKTIDLGKGSAFSRQQFLGIDLIINPYEVAAEHLERLVLHPQATDFESFLEGQVLLVRIPIGEGNPLAGGSVADFGRNAHIPQTLIALIQSEQGAVIPGGENTIQLGDRVYFFCQRDQLPKLLRYLKLPTRAARRVFINGGGHIGFALAKRLQRRGLDVRILEISEQRARVLSQQLEGSLVLHADGTDSAALKAEGIDRADFFISVTAEDQINVVSCLLAKEYGAARTVALVKQPEYIPILTNRQLIDIAFSPRLLTARKILQFVRGQNLNSFFAFGNSDIELLELEIQSGMACEKCRLADLNFPEGMLVGAVKRGGSIFLPRGDDHLMGGDTILLLQQRRNRQMSNSLFNPPVSPTGGAPETNRPVVA